MADSGVPVVAWSELNIIEKVGEGGFADVYKATFRGELVGVKMWRYQELPPEQVRLFQREIQIGSVVSHPNCVRLFAVCLEPVALIMEYIPGCDLYDYIHNPANQLTWGMVKAMALDMLRGIAHLHERNVLHRDLKSPNFLINTTTFQVKVCDFGLSRLKEATVKLTGGRGTVHWMAPEVIQHSDYGAPADMYSYGVCLWELVSRQLPFADIFRDQVQVAEAVVLRGRRPTIPPDCPPLLANLIQQCWATDPAHRPTAVQALRYWEHPLVIPPALMSQPIVGPGGAPRGTEIL